MFDPYKYHIKEFSCPWILGKPLAWPETRELQELQAIAMSSTDMLALAVGNPSKRHKTFRSITSYDRSLLFCGWQWWYKTCMLTDFTPMILKTIFAAKMRKTVRKRPSSAPTINADVTWGNVSLLALSLLRVWKWSPSESAEKRGGGEEESSCWENERAHTHTSARG